MSAGGDGPEVGPRIFLSYRREDSGGYAGHLYADLAVRFGEQNVFIDIDSIEPGLDYVELLEQTLTKCNTCLVLIGRSWLSAVGRDGKRRIENPNDLVRFEIERALSSRTCRVVPVLVGDAEVPDPDELPESLVPLTRRQAFEVSDKRWPFDVGVLANKLERAAQGNPTDPQGSQGDKSATLDLTETTHSWDPHGEASEALGSIVAIYGPDSLADADNLANHLREHLSEDRLPREQSLLLAASKRGVANELKNHVTQGTHIDTAVRLTAQRLREREPFDSSGCEWVTNTYARALGHRDPPLPSVDASVHDRSEPSASRGSKSERVAADHSGPPRQAGSRSDSLQRRVVGNKTEGQAPLGEGDTARKSLIHRFGWTRTTRRVGISASALMVLAAVGIAVAVSTTSPTSASGAPAVQQPYWSEPTPVAAGADQVEAVSCPSISFCMAVDNDRDAFLYRGSGGWSAYRNIFPAGPLQGLASISCLSDNFCMAVTNDGYALSYDGSEWSKPTKIADVSTLKSVSCSSPSFCMAVDDNGDAHAYHGGEWDAADEIDSRGLTSVSCPAATFCVTVDKGGSAFAYSSLGWRPDSPDVTSKLTSVSCTSENFCLAVGTGGIALQLDGGIWSPPVYVDGVNPDNSNATWVSCSSRAFCMAVDDAGNAMGYENGRWSTYIKDDAQFKGVSCWSTKFCWAVLASGNLVSASPNR